MLLCVNADKKRMIATADSLKEGQSLKLKGVEVVVNVLFILQLVYNILKLTGEKKNILKPASSFPLTNLCAPSSQLATFLEKSKNLHGMLLLMWWRGKQYGLCSDIIFVALYVALSPYATLWLVVVQHPSVQGLPTRSSHI